MYYKRGKKYYLTVIGVMLLLVFTFAISGCQKKTVKPKNNLPINMNNSTQEPNYDTQFLGVVKEINEAAGTITLFHIDEDKDITLFYTGGTDVKDQYEQILSMKQIDLGEIVDAYYVNKSSKLVKMQISNKAWEYKSVNRIKIDNSNKIIKIVDRMYRFNENIIISGEDGLMSLIDLNDRDELTVKGVEGKVYSITVTKGHGYIRLINYDDFIGGTIEVGYGIIMPVMENMLIVAREGSYKVSMENGELFGQRNVTVTRNKEITLDMGAFRIARERVGTVNFAISPEGAELYINGALVDYTEPIELNYGEHTVVAKLAGYKEFRGLLSVGAAYQTISINLAAATAEVVDEDVTAPPVNSGGSGSNQTDDSNSNNQDSEPDNIDDTSGTNITVDNSNTDTPANNTGTVKIDNNHTITIKAPVGAKVYLNGVLKGTAPTSFPKEIGTHIITFSMDGYITKSYTIVVADDSENVSFTFPDMIKATN